MSDLDLTKLKNMPVPTPNADARKAALDAAMQAFDATAKSADAKTAAAPKDVVAFPRPMRSADGERKRPMLAQHKAALAASVALVVIGGPMALYVLAPQLQQRTHNDSGVKPASQPITAPVIAALPEPREAGQDRAPAERGRTQTETPRKVEADAKPSDDALSKINPVSPPAAAPAPAIPGMVLEQERARSKHEADLRLERQAEEEAKRIGELRHQRPANPNVQHGGEDLTALLPKSAAPPTAAAPPRVAAAPPPVAFQEQRRNLRGDVADGQRKAIDGSRRQQLGGAQPGAAPPAQKVVGLVAPEPALPPQVEQGRDTFDATPPNPVKSTAAEPVSTFSIDVDTASYAFVRRALNSGRLPQKDAVRVEEMINYFPYDYARADTTHAPFKPTVTVMPSPWNVDNRLVHIAIKGYDIARTDRPRANLVLLVDISGSMGPADRLPLLKNAFRMLVDNLQPEDTIAIVTYASGSDIRLAPTKVSEKSKIIAAIDSLKAGGSTHGAAGITDAYKVAEASFDKAAVNRVILATDGDWNVGITNRTELKSFIERKRESGVYLSILGVGMGNHNDHLMQTLAQNGNGVAAYIDTLAEARKVLVEEASSSLFPIAKDVKIQIEFNPALVSEYRLIGYETRMLARADFNNDKVDAGDVGSGHSVTAIYEVTPVGAPRLVDGLRYGPAATTQATAPAQPAPPADQARRRIEPTSPQGSELGFLKIRYKLPKEETSRLIELPITPSLAVPTIAAAPEDVRFSVAVAAFGQLLKGQPHMKSYSFDDVIALANSAKGADPFGYRAEMVSLVRLAKSARP